MAKYTKRRDKRGYEWKSAYREKEALMLERGYPEVSPHDFYRELFPAGSLQQEPEDGKGNIIATQIRPSGKGRLSIKIQKDGEEPIYESDGISASNEFDVEIDESGTYTVEVTGKKAKGSVSFTVVTNQ